MRWIILMATVEPPTNDWWIADFPEHLSDEEVAGAVAEYVEMGELEGHCLYVMPITDKDEPIEVGSRFGHILRHQNMDDVVFESIEDSHDDKTINWQIEQAKKDGWTGIP